MPQSNRSQGDSRENAVLFWVCMSIVVLVPLVFSTAVYRTFVLPKFSILIVGSSLILMLTGVVVYRSRGDLSVLRSKHVALALLYVLVTAVSTVLGVVPLASFFGSFQSEMGLISRLCFLACFLGVVVSIGRSHRRLIATAWVVATTGFVAAFYAFIQFFGWDPLLPLSAYEYPSAGGLVVRAIGTLGHSNYLGNFLLYTTPVGAALAFAWRGRARRLATTLVAFSTAAIAFSGTRGAWLGLLFSAGALVLMEGRKLGKASPKTGRRGMLVRVAFAGAGILVIALIIVSSPASRNVATRVRSFTEEGFTGAGRILLWRDAIRMVPRFAVFGYGPEAFSREFLRYKSFDLARSAPQINNESSHDSYLDAALSFGLPGAALYVGLITSAFALLVRARRRTVDRRIAWLISGLLASLAGVVVHNLFIYDQIPTGLYFFLFMSLALAAWNVSAPPKAADSVKREFSAGVFAGAAMASAGAVLIVATTWYAVSLVGSDVALKRAIGFSATRDLLALIDQGSRATRGFDPTGAYDFQVARALASYADRVPHPQMAETPASEEGNRRKSARTEALKLASSYALKALPHTLTPDANYMLLAYLAFQEGEAGLGALGEYARSAVEWDPNYFNAHWLMAEALLAEGDRTGAIHEAEIALELNPKSSEAKAVLDRARGAAQFTSLKIKRGIAHARRVLERGDVDRAEIILQRAIRRSGGSCADCHQELALTYERGRRYKEAIAEWETYAREAPDQAIAQGVQPRIEELRGK
jgi:O-antigen ligase/tetratricopeptide (TPR) repeat protein